MYKRECIQVVKFSGHIDSFISNKIREKTRKEKLDYMKELEKKISRHAVINYYENDNIVIECHPAAEFIVNNRIKNFINKL